MPGGDRTGPAGQGPRTGRGMAGRGQGGAGAGAGAGGDCVCPSCGERVAHRPGSPCTNERCPKCGSPMIRA